MFNTVPLISLCKDVIDCPHSTPVWKDEGIFVVRNFNINNGTLDLSEASYVDEDTYLDRTKRAIPEAGDLIISREAPMGQVCMVPDGLKCCLGQRLVLLKVNKEICDPNYLLYAMQSEYVKKQIAVVDSTGSIVSNLNIPDLKQLQIPVNDEQTQKEIGKTLSLINAKIAINKVVIAKLEAMAKTIYDYWFVQFDFPNAEGKPYRTSGGEMEWNEKLKRDIPNGWGASQVNELLDKVPNTNKVLSSDYLPYGKTPIIDQSKDYIAGYTNIPNTEISLPGGAIIFGDHTRVVKYVNFGFARGADGTQVIISNNDRVPQLLLYHMIMKIDLSNYGYARHYKFLKDISVIMPQKVVSKAFTRVLDPQYQMITKLLFTNIELARLRDWLLPMLMNGQVTVG